MFRLVSSVWLVCLLALPLIAADNHLDLNPVFKSLLSEGVGQGGEYYRLPPPRFSDQQDKPQQRAVLDKLLDDDMRSRFLRNSPVAPHIIKLGEQPGAEKSRIRHAAFLFSIYAELEDMMQSDFFDRLGQAATDAESENQDASSSDRHVWTDHQLEARQISFVGAGDRREVFAFGKVRLLKRVDVAATTHSCWSRTPQSVVAAFVVDPRFQDDELDPNRWWPLVRNDAGELISGTPQPYQGAGGYLRLTQLAEPRGCLIAEGHVAFVEPRGWFRGVNLLASKLPAIIQTSIRRTRQSLADRPAASVPAIQGTGSEP